MRAVYLFLLLFAMVPINVGAQGNLAEKKRQAKEFFLNAHYQDAFQILQVAEKNQQVDKESSFLMALCLYQLNRLNEAESILQTLIAEKSAFSETWLYMARIYHERHQFLLATDYYKAYLKTLSANDSGRSAIREAIRRCSNGLQWQYRTPLAIVENLGPGINSAFDEFGPVISPTNTERLYFSSARPGCSGGARNSNGQPDEVLGRYTCDIFYSQFSAGQWGTPKGLSTLVNSPKHEIVFDFGAGGTTMYYFKGNSFSQGQIFIDSFRTGSTNTLNSDILFSPIDAISGISAPHFAYDSVVIFPSQRPGGFGGLDLYQTIFSNGRWSTPQNLGAEINSPYDETTPFLARDGRSLYYSSNNVELSIGGFDVVKSVFNPYTASWTTPINVGLPINSAGDETHFRLARDGYTAYFASSRKDGYGERDLYAAYFFDYLPEMGTASYQPRQPDLAPEVFASKGGAAQIQPTSLRVFPLYFDRKEELTTPRLTTTLDTLAALLIQTPGIKLLITGYSQTELSPSSRLFGGVEAARSTADYLIKKGVPAHTIQVNGAISTRAMAAQKGIDLFFISPPPNFNILYDLGISGSISEDTSRLTYALKIVTSDTIYRGTLLTQMEYPVVYYNRFSKGTYFYYAGRYASFSAAKLARTKFQGMTPDTIQIVPFYKKEPLNGKNISRYTAAFPDLKYFINEEKIE